MGALHIMKTSAALGTFPVQLTIPSYQVCVFAWCTGSLLWMWWRPWTLSAHKAATLKKNLFCSLSH